ncbi:hypothetical protein CC80DRAFT_514377 [Byssothecium circinans]|uniref:Pentatricopeptide repeat protein n=1 Tax=Byssothecium circinans TaxID=147558 RepID=A0A6A5TAU0_9PLEO|nr:hypothetical protein CC80DRAFT_429067 [Byssothecium circinans]KAF1959033.1 hypothetical protein CC80DRAFT_514377 [Byssothecium circinans]
MATVGKSSTVGSRTAYLEQKFLDGEEEQALAEWEADHASAGPGARQDYKPEHLETGAKLYALAGNADRAREVMEELYELYPTWNPSVMMHVFRVHTDTDSDQHRAEAWKIYINMRRLMLKSLTLDHYDAWFVGFLEARHVRYAKLVFRDMIKGGFLAASSSPNDIEATLRRFHLLTRLGTDIERITSLSLQAITTLPSVYHLHVFGYWMEAAVKFIAPQAAANILDMMFTRNYRPGTTHFNLFLRALLRTQEAQQVTKAENIGWRMIEETRVARSDRKSPISASEIIFSRYSTIVEPVLDSDAARKVPQANVTTFALIMQHHAAREQWEHVEYLARRLKESETFPNSTLMNVLMNNACRKGKFTEAWKLYKSLTNVPEDTPGVFPDGASIRCVWKMLRLALGNESTRDDPELPRPRQLLAETISWWHLCRSRHDSEQFRTGLAAENKTALTNLVMHCFSYTEDIAGSLVALHAMRRYLHIFPTDDVAYILQRQAAWVDMQREEPAVRARYNLNKMRRETLAKLAGVYDILLQKRLERLGYTGDEEYARMSDDEIGDHGLNLLSEFVRVVMKRTYEPDVVEAMIQQAKEDAGVPDMATGDLTAFEVA